MSSCEVAGSPFIRVPPVMSHKHAWTVRKCQQIGVAPSALFSMQLPRTIVLLRCGCGDVATRVLDGNWNQADLAGVS